MISRKTYVFVVIFAVASVSITTNYLLSDASTDITVMVKAKSTNASGDQRDQTREETENRTSKVDIDLTDSSIGRNRSSVYESKNNSYTKILKTPKSQVAPHSDPSVKTILIWTLYNTPTMRRDRAIPNFGLDVFGKRKCRHSNCKLTFDR